MSKLFFLFFPIKPLPFGTGAWRKIMEEKEEVPEFKYVVCDADDSRILWVSRKPVEITNEIRVFVAPCRENQRKEGTCPTCTGACIM